MGLFDIFGRGEQKSRERTEISRFNEFENLSTPETQTKQQPLTFFYPKDFAEVANIIDCLKEITSFSGIKVIGLMAMLPKTDDLALKEKLCLQMREMFDKLKAQGLPFEYLSMGMSNDYKTAIKCGSNMIRLGSYIFGQRNYGDTQNGII